MAQRIDASEGMLYSEFDTSIFSLTAIPILGFWKLLPTFGGCVITASSAKMTEDHVIEMEVGRKHVFFLASLSLKIGREEGEGGGGEGVKDKMLFSVRCYVSTWDHSHCCQIRSLNEPSFSTTWLDSLIESYDM